MAQTTDGMSFAAHYLAFSKDGSSWTNVSGFSNSVNVTGGERVIGYGFTADGDTPIQKAGKRQGLTVTTRIVYTETADEAYDMAKDQYELTGGGAFYVRWSPGGGDAADLGFTTAAGLVKNPPYPAGTVESGEPIFCEVVMECPSIAESTIGTAGWT
jgi:hypothetical protein